MADLFLNFKDFKHEKTDDKSTTLRHKKLGHAITLAHNVLSSKNKEALMAMAKSAKQDRTPDQAGEAESQDSGYGKVIKMANGGTSSANRYLQNPRNRAPGDNSDTPPPTPQTQQEVKKDVGTKASGGGQNHPTLDPRSWMADGGDVEAASQVPQWLSDSAGAIPAQPQQEEPGILQNVGNAAGQYFANKVINPIKGAVELGKLGIGAAREAGKGFTSGVEKGTGVDLSGKDEEQQAPVSNPAVPSPAPNEPAPQPMTANQAPPIATPPNPMAQGASDAENLMTKGYQNQIEGIRQESAAKQGLGEANAQVLAKDAQSRVQAQTAFQDHFNELDKERQALQADIQNGHIDPNKFWSGDENGNGGHSKIAAGIGMILAGFNPTNSPNAAINFLKYQMDQNLEAQKQNLGSKQNLLSANLRQFGNLKDATEMTRIMQGDILTNELKTAEAKAATPMAKAAALNAQGQLQAQMAPIFQQFALRRAMVGLANNGGDPSAVDHLLAYARIANPDMAKEMEQRYIPGVGMGKVPVPESVRSQIVSAKTTNDLFNDSLQLAHQPIPNPATHPLEYRKYVNTADTLRNQLIGSIKQQQHDGVYKPSEAEFLIKQIGDSPASVFRAVSSIPKIQELQKIKQQEYSNMLNTYGIPNQQLPSAPSQSSGLQEGRTGVLNGKRVKVVNGKLVPQ